MTQTRGVDESSDRAPAMASGLQNQLEGCGVESTVALMRAGNALAAALDQGGRSAREVEQLVQAWHDALFAAARECGHQHTADRSDRR